MLSLVLVAFMRFDLKDGKNLKVAYETMLKELDRDPKSARMQRFASVIEGLRMLNDHRVADALERARHLSKDMSTSDFDLEAASLLVGFWVRVAGQEIQLEEMDEQFNRIGLRYCTTKSSTEVLAAMTEGNEHAKELIRNCHAKIFSIAETAMRHAMRGSAEVGVELLIQQGEETRNAKLIDMAELVLKRHAEKIPHAEQLSQQIVELQKQYVLPLSTRTNIRNRREAGGMTLRG
ncbi:MAG: hypothetical protein JO002_13690 [Burkholderiaceae bacterium]|nr:hypothetical protein [Burkholderiaceae bacterium]